MPDYALASPLNTRTVVAFLTGDNRQVDLQNIGFAAGISDPTLDPDFDPSPVPLPASAFPQTAALGGLGVMRRNRPAKGAHKALFALARPRGEGRPCTGPLPAG